MWQRPRINLGGTRQFDINFIPIELIGRWWYSTLGQSQLDDQI